MNAMTRSIFEEDRVGWINQPHAMDLSTMRENAWQKVSIRSFGFHPNPTQFDLARCSQSLVQLPGVLLDVSDVVDLKFELVEG
jgi:hypothetical protein